MKITIPNASIKRKLLHIVIERNGKLSFSFIMGYFIEMLSVVGVFQGIFDNALIILDISWTWKFFLVSTYTSNNLFSLGTSWVSLDAQCLVAPVLTLTLSSIASTLSSLISSTERPYFFL